MNWTITLEATNNQSLLVGFLTNPTFDNLSNVKGELGTSVDSPHINQMFLVLQASSDVNAVPPK